MDYKIGDTVVHWTHGLGKVIAIEELSLGETIQAYYVVDINPLKLWVPVGEANQGSMRFPVKSGDFKQMIHILRTPGAQLTRNAYKRKAELRERIQKRTLADLCHLIRDLAALSRQRSLNENDAAVLFRAEEFLLDEWVFSLGAERSNAQNELDFILRGETFRTVTE
jgi:RNA polymerase-interacting CarD/CdnL/TRCF family regulator